MNEDIKEHLNNLINNFNNMAYTEQQEELLELYKTGEVEYVDVVDRYSDLSKNYKKLQQENKQLKKQLEYLRNGEYLNQLKFERNMLEDLVQNMEVSKEDKEFIDMTRRNTELLEENQQLKEVIEEVREYIEKECSDLLIGYFHNRFDTTKYYEKLLQILDKGESNE